jgi:20S proteasome subunit alpha 6
MKTELIYIRHAPAQSTSSTMYHSYQAFSIGAKSQSAKTYFEKHCDEFKTATAEQLIMHGLAALKASENDIELSEKNVTLAIVGKGTEFKQFKESEIAPYLQKLKQQAPAAGERMVA